MAYHAWEEVESSMLMKIRKYFNENLENFFVRNRLYIIIIDKNKIYRSKYNYTAVWASVIRYWNNHNHLRTGDTSPIRIYTKPFQLGFKGQKGKYLYLFNPNNE